MNSTDFSIAVVMAIFNGEQFLPMQLGSILEQTRLPDEIILVDDGSTDNSYNIAKNLLKDKIKYTLIQHTQNQGVNKTFEDAVNKTACDYIMFCDQDDVWKKNKIELFTQTIAKCKNSLMFFSDAVITDEKLERKKNSLMTTIHWPIKVQKQYITLSSENLCMLLLRRNYVTGMCMTVRREYMDSCIPFSENMTFDAWIAWHYALLGEATYINDKLVFYRQHKNNAIGIDKKRNITYREYFLTKRKLDKKRLCLKYEDLYKHAEKNQNPIKTIVKKGCDFYIWRRFYENGRTTNTKQLIENIKNKNYFSYTARANIEIVKDFVEIVCCRKKVNRKT